MKIDVQYYAKSQVKSKKKASTSTDIQFSTQNQVKTKKRSLRPQTTIFRAKSGDYSKLEQEKKKKQRRRCPIICPKSSAKNTSK